MSPSLNGRSVTQVRPLSLPAVLKVVGVSFRQDVVSVMAAGDRVVAVAVDNNPHDENAIEFRTVNGDVLGYVGRPLTERLRATGATAWTGELTEVLRGESMTGLRVRLLGPVSVDAVIPERAQPLSVDDTTSSPLPIVPLPVTAEPAPIPQVMTEDHFEAIQPGTVMFTVSGRIVGEFIAGDDDDIIVERNEQRFRYPAAHIVRPAAQNG